MDTALRIFMIGALALLGTARCDSPARPAQRTPYGRYQVVSGLVGGYVNADGHQYGAFIRIDTETGRTWIYRGETEGWFPLNENRIGTSADLPAPQLDK